MTFKRLLKQTGFTKQMIDLMNIIEDEYGYPVDIEFTLNFTEDESYRINIVQCRPHQTNIISDDLDFDEKSLDNHTVVFQSKSNFMGGGTIMRLHQVVIVDPYEYSHLEEHHKFDVARAIRQINNVIPECGRNTLLLGPADGGLRHQRWVFL